MRGSTYFTRSVARRQRQALDEQPVMSNNYTFLMGLIFSFIAYFIYHNFSAKTAPNNYDQDSSQ